MRITLRSFIPAAMAFIAATVLFCLPGDEFPEQEWFGKVLLDKWIHVGLFASLVALWCLPFIPKRNSKTRLVNLFIKISFAFALYGIIIEFIQGNFIPNRTFGLDDMVADSAGCALGFWFANWQLRKQLQ